MKERVSHLKKILPLCMLRDQVRLGWQLQRALKDPTLLNIQLLNRLQHQAQESVDLREWRQINLPKCVYSPLPVSDRKDEIIDLIRKNQVLVIAGETGSGKTTQLPKMCLDAGLGVRAMIGCTQPRRVAAMSLSQRLADELKVDWGKEVGCKIRFSDHSRPETFIKMMTDGILLTEIQSDPLLCEYDAILIDEAHERSLNIDFLLGYLQTLVKKRDDLKLIITSATIDTEAFSKSFGGVPVIEVSGRTYPVELIYRPINDVVKENLNDDETQENISSSIDEYSFVDGAVDLVSELVQTTSGGDILVFLPCERDIRETAASLEGKHWGNIEILTLFGRQTSSEQQAVFVSSRKRRVVIATNIAETSLTIPNIHFVVDTGLARISRYNARTRTKRLPIEFISQSSANQRKGRCGRVASGVCYRLYSESDFEALTPYTQPEIQRANLAEVILRMKAFKLGEVETFPFINPPSSQAVHAGYILLQELGALDGDNQLTRRGMDLARMAVDPSLGRMILQARDEGVLDEILTIASGLSIQDPRERPMEMKAQAETAHKQFADSESDFITLLNLWDAWQKAWKQLKTQNQVRKFCKNNYLSFVRMREWADLYAQLLDTIEKLTQKDDTRIKINRSLPKKSQSVRVERNEVSAYQLEFSQEVRDGIHRSILSGLLGHIAHREEKNSYLAVGNRKVTIFPGSGLFGRTTPMHGKKKDSGEEKTQKEQSVQPEWIVGGEIVETSRLFIRTVAGINIEWVEDLAPHVCKKTYHDPHWDEKTERVLVQERVTTHGLLVRNRWIDFGKVNPSEATDIFIRMALVENGLQKNIKFLDHNRALCQKLELWQTQQAKIGSRKRSESAINSLQDLDLPFITLSHSTRGEKPVFEDSATDLHESLKLFYAARIQNVSSIHDLNRLLKEHSKDKTFLFAEEKDLLGSSVEQYDAEVFPDKVKISGYDVSAQYAYAPGKEHDGVTLKIPLPLLPVAKASEVGWSIPGFRIARWEEILDNLPRAIKRRLMPLRDRAIRLAQEIKGTDGNYLEEARKFIFREWDVDIPSGVLSEEKISEYLTPKIEVINNFNKILFTGVNIAELQSQIKEHKIQEDKKDWQRAAGQFEHYGLTEWNLGDVPDEIVIKMVAGIPLKAFPGLIVEDDSVNLHLFKTPAERDASIWNGAIALTEKMLSKEFAWLQRDLKKMEQPKLLYSTLGTSEDFEETAYINLRNSAFGKPKKVQLSRKYFENLVWEARSNLRENLPLFTDLVKEILELRQKILVHPREYQGMKKELNMLVSRRFLAYIDFERLKNLPRYLKAMLIRADRAFANPSRDWEKTQKVIGFQKELDDLMKRKDILLEDRKKLWDLFWLMQEFRVSCYAQELGTTEPVSPRKIQQLIADIKELTQMSR